jgi:hypothetical protein
MPHERHTKLGVVVTAMSLAQADEVSILPLGQNLLDNPGIRIVGARHA